MKAAVFERFGDPAEVLTVQEKPQPEPGPNEVRVRMLASPINPSDLMSVRGIYGRLPTLPATPGFEGVGIIDKVGPGLLKIVRGLKPGRRVAVLNSRGGNWQESVVISARQAVPVDDLSDAQAATFFVNPATAVVMTRQVLRVPSGGWLLQTAAGSALGQMVQRLGQHDGFKVLNVVRRREQAERMQQAGLVAVCSEEPNFVEQVKKRTGGDGVRYAIDAVGGSTALLAAKCLAPGGKLLLYGTLSPEPLPLEPRVLMVGQSCIQGFWLSEWVKQQGIFTMLGLFRQLKKLIRAGVLATEVTEYPLADIQRAAADAEKPGRATKVVLRIGAA